MKEHLLNAWKTALTSGRFKQGNGALCRLTRTTDEIVDRDTVGSTVKTTVTHETLEHCCLGVLAQVATDLNIGNFAFMFSHFDGDAEVDRRSVCMTSGGSSGKFYVDALNELGLTPEAQAALIALNDQDAPFKAIAAALPSLIKLGGGELVY